MNMVDAPLFDHERAQQLVSIYRGWHAYETALDPNNIIVDSDMSGVTTRAGSARKFINREQIRRQFSPYLDALGRRVPDLPILDQRRALYAYLNASDVFLVTQAYPIDLQHYLENTMGVKPEFFDEEKDIGEAGRVLHDKLAKAGFSDPVMEVALAKYREEKVMSPEEVSENMVRIIETRLPVFMEYMGFSDLDPEIYNPSQLIQFFTDPDEYFRMEAYYRNNKHTVRVNTAKDYYLGDDEYFAFHEYFVHKIAQAITKAKIGRGEIIPDLGIETLHGPNVFVGEGLGKTLPDFLPQDVFNMSPFGELVYAYRRYRDMIYNNMHLIANQTPRLQSTNEALMYVKDKFAGVIDNNDIEERVKQATTDQLERSAGYIYGRAAASFEEIAAKLKTDSKRREFLLAHYGMPIIFDQSQEIARLLIEEAA